MIQLGFVLEKAAHFSRLVKGAYMDGFGSEG
jgi:hypothetical protein